MSESEERREDDNSSVRVAIRIRPQNAREKIDACQMCTTVVHEEQQILLGKDKAFTFDYVYDVDTQQNAIYNNCVRNLVEGCFEGYNATVFAYGQTGSGKTYTMGTGFDTALTTVTDDIGIIPRAVDHLFMGIEERRRQAFENGEPAPDFKVTAQFMELYNEEIFDLLDTTKDPNLKGKKSQNRIHEDASGGIFVVGVNTRPVTSLDETLQCLKSGALSRATASTNMNVSSSRSHAIFTLHVRQHRMVKDEAPLEEGKDNDSTQTEFETLTAKFHFVDLAGSERLKRTGATGDRAKEGISINCGLLALGNVISALGDQTKRGSHVPYRDSKLTRLLQDSLGGNSRTLMIACISPSDRDFMETLNTLKYANRARNIKNKVTANQDKASKQLAQLRAEIATLQQELMEFKTGKRMIDSDGIESVNDLVTENSMLQLENDKLRQRIKAMQDTVEMLKARNAQLLADAAVFSVLGTDGQAKNEDVSNLIKKYIHEIEDLKTKLAESESLCEHLNKSTVRSPRSSGRMSVSSTSLTSSFLGGMEAPESPDYMKTSVLSEAKKEMKRLQKLQKSYSHTLNQESDKENIHAGPSTRDDDQATSQEKSDEEINGDDDDIGDEEDDTDVDEEHSDSDISSGSDGGESDNVHEDLANVMCEITIKQRLIEELEQTQKKMNSLKAHYESKVQQLHQKIRETEIERDKVLSEIEKMSHSTTDTTKKVKQEFEKKLGTLQEELKKMQSEQRKHAKVQKNNCQYERHLKTLQHELAEMKKTKVKLMKQVKEEVDKNRQNEMRHNKEFSQLRKEHLKKDNIIKTLERQTVQKDVVLKRKQEEVEALRKRQKPMSAKTAGRVGKYDRPTTVPIVSVSLTSRRRRKSEFSPKVAKQKWDSLDKNIAAVISKRQTVSMLERDMNVWLKQREKCIKQIEKYERRKQDALNSRMPEEAIHRLNRTIEDLTLKVEHAQENINECQSNIMQIEESKEDRDGSVEINSLLEAITLEESRYIIEKFYQKELDSGFVIVQKESEMKELQGRLHQTELNNALQQDLLRHMMDDNVSIEVDDLMTHNDPDADNSYVYSSDIESSSSSTSSSPAESMMESAVMPGVSSREKLTRREKARRKTATAQDLLYAGGNEPSPLHPLMEAPDETKESVDRVSSSGTLAPSFAVRLLKTSNVGGDAPPVNVVANVGSTESLGNGTEVKSPVSDGDKLLMPPSRLPLKQRLSPILRRKELPQRESSPILGRRSLSRSISLGDTSSDTTPPASPTTVRRSMTRSTDENVFSRLTSNTASSLTNPDRGSIVPSWSRQPGASKAILTCTHTAEGHTKSVLSVFATDHLLFTGSKDRTAKVWDLGTGKELMSFSGHPNNVHKVTYCSHTQLVLTVSHSSIRVWDMRSSSEPCIKTLSSSGLTTSGSGAYTVSKLTDSLFRDHQVNDIQLSPDGSTLFCGAGNVVQIWDLRRFSLAGRLSGHQAPVMALALNCDGEHNMVISGSKDHYIKIFEVIEDAAGIIFPKYNLEPPHYDGIQSLALRGNVLFSGSRDMCIKKWDLTSRQLRHSINAAHKDWVCALDFVPGTNILLSGCRGGFLKMWQPDTCVSLGEIRAHSTAINAIATNSTSIFTASNDTTVHIWRTTAQLRAKLKSSRHRLL